MSDFRAKTLRQPAVFLRPWEICYELAQLCLDEFFAQERAIFKRFALKNTSCVMWLVWVWVWVWVRLVVCLVGCCWVPFFAEAITYLSSKTQGWLGEG